MTFDKFVEILRSNEELVDWYIEGPVIKGNELRSARVIFEFAPEPEEEKLIEQD